MARPIWTGTISFGLVSVPVKLYSATSPKEVRFHMLHDKDGGRIQQKRVCSIDGEEVPWEHIIKGFELSKGRYVSVTRKELEQFNPRATRSIDIEDFVRLEQIDPIFYQSTYYLLPDKGSAKPYALLVEAMRRTGRVGVARFVLRSKQYLCAVRPKERALVLSTMLYGDEVVSEGELEEVPSGKPGERELKMAGQLIDSLAADFDAAKYKDEYRDQVLAMLERKAEGEPIEVGEAAPRAKVVDLMEALKKSLASSKKGDRGEIRHRAEHHRRAARVGRANNRARARRR
ncbi:MAG TPA: Ku protein [Myxococcales bacterium]|nr:Ku protein [Myxococcales bacterium]